MHILFYTAKKKQIPKRRNANLLIIHGRTTPEVLTTKCANDHVSLKSKQQNVVSTVQWYYEYGQRKKQIKIGGTDFHTTKTVQGEVL